MKTDVGGVGAKTVLLHNIRRVMRYPDDPSVCFLSSPFVLSPEGGEKNDRYKCGRRRGKKGRRLAETISDWQSTLNPHRLHILV